MAPKTVLSKQDILNALSQCDVFVNHNEWKLKHRNNIVWQNVCNILKNKIKPSTLNLKVKFNKNGLLDDLLTLKRNMQFSPKKIDKESINYNASTSSNNASDDISMPSFFDTDIDDAINCSEFREEQMLHEQVQIMNSKDAIIESDTRNIANLPGTSFPNPPTIPPDTSAASLSTGLCPLDSIQFNDDVAENTFCTFTLPASFLHKYWAPNASRFKPG